MLDALAREIRDRGGQARAIPTDVTDPETVSALAEGAVRAFGGIDVRIDDAGAGVYGPLLDAPPRGRGRRAGKGVPSAGTMSLGLTSVGLSAAGAAAAVLPGVAAARRT